MEYPVKFRNLNGKELFGILHAPEDNNIRGARVGVNLLNPGIKYRVAPHRLNVKIARMLCKAGLPVFRFDPEGIGDSEGELTAGKGMPEVWGDIQRGRFVRDVLESNQHFKDICGLKKIILMGNCGGAVTAALAAPNDESVDGLILIDLPVMMIGSDYSYSDKIIDNKEVIDYLFTEYVKNLFRISSWKNMLRGRTDIRAIKKVMKSKGLKMLSFLILKEETCNEIIDDPRVHKALFHSINIMMKKEIKMLFIAAGGDIGTDSFNHYFKKYLGNRKYNSVDIHTVEGANHIYTLHEWQEDLMNKISWWISEKYTE